jgi:DNA-binding transcriptional LysR family regulator
MQLGGRLRVSAPVVLGRSVIASALLSFAEAHPSVEVELLLSNSELDLVENGFDLAFREGRVHGADLVARRIWSVPYALGASPSFVQRELDGRMVLEDGELAALPSIAAGHSVVWRFCRRDGSTQEFRPRVRFCVSDLGVAVKAAQRGLGVVYAPERLIVGANLIVLQTSAETGRPEPRDTYAVYPTRHFVPKRVRLAVESVARAGASMLPPSDDDQDLDEGEDCPPSSSAQRVM